MSPRKALAPEGDHGAFAQKLRYWRQMRRLSQLDLALSSGVSQRHVSFLESGRAKPSRTMILQLSESLGVPLRERNDFLVAGGFAPMFKARPLDDPQMAQVLGAVRMMLDSHAPFPAVAIDRAWNIRLSNAAFDRIGMMMGEDVWARVGGDSRNLMRLFFHPDGIRNLVLNWRAIAPLLWHRAQREADTMAGEDMQALLGALRPFQDEHTLGGASSAGLVPVLPLELGAGEVRLSMFSVIATFGTALDITAEELRIESFFPADAATENLLRAAASG
jgi:transcriptional regulator with XRE-family HTH domain